MKPDVKARLSAVSGLFFVCLKTKGTSFSLLISFFFALCIDMVCILRAVSCLQKEAMAVTISGEWFICANVLLDAACLHAVSRMGARRVRAGRIMLSSLLGTLCAMAAMACWGYRAAAHAALPIAALMALTTFGPRGTPRGMTRLMLLALLTSGLAHLLHGLGWHVAAVFLSLLPAVEFFLRSLQAARSHAGERCEVRLLFDSGGVSLCGMFDSGNLLRDPVTALPVVVVPFEAVRAYLPRGIELERFETLPRGFRLLSVHTAAGTRLMMCFRPRALFIRRERVWRAFNAVVAVSGALSGDRAILPPGIEA